MQWNTYLWWVRRGEQAFLQFIVEFAAIICTGLKSVFRSVRAAEIRVMQWKVTSVQRKGSSVQRKASPSAVESWSSHHTIELIAPYGEPYFPFPDGNLPRTHRLRSYKSPQGHLKRAITWHPPDVYSRLLT